MDRKAAGLLGAVASLAGVAGAQAASRSIPDVSDALKASSYADLLAPIPNAVALLKADNARQEHQAKAASDIQEVQFYYYYGRPVPYNYGPPAYYPPTYYYPPYYHHHHHHHSHYRHHHHHHHHWSGGWR